MADGKPEIKKQELWLIMRLRQLKHGSLEVSVQDGLPIKTSNEKGTADHTYQEEKNLIETNNDHSKK